MMGWMAAQWLDPSFDQVSKKVRNLEFPDLRIKTEPTDQAIRKNEGEAVSEMNNRRKSRSKRADSLLN